MTTVVLDAQDHAAETAYDVDDVEYLRHGDKPLLARVFRPRGEGPYPALVEALRDAFRGDIATPLRHTHMIQQPGGSEAKPCGNGASARMSPTYQAAAGPTIRTGADSVWSRRTRGGAKVPPLARPE